MRRQIHVPRVLDYHERTKLPAEGDGSGGGPSSKAVPFVRFAGSQRVLLEKPASLVARRARRVDPLTPEALLPPDFGDPRLAAPAFDRLFGAERRRHPAELGARSLSLFLVDAAGLSARQRGPGRWRRRLRVVPARNDIPAVSTYLLAPPLEGVGAMAGLHHYAPLRHELERRYVLSDGEWLDLVEGLPGPPLVLGLTAIPGRLEPMAGERAFRDTHLELGHTLASSAFSAACLGWRVHLLDGLGDDRVETILALDPDKGELPGALLAVSSRDLDDDRQKAADFRVDEGVFDLLSMVDTEGSANLAPAEDVPTAIAVASSYEGEGGTRPELAPPVPSISAPELADPRPGRGRGLADAQELAAAHDARGVIRSRRSASAMDPRFGIDRRTFVRLMRLLVPASSAFPWSDVLPWRPRVAALVFVHRVAGLEPGLYLLGRHPDQVPSLRRAARRDGLLWESVESVDGSHGLDLHLLRTADARESAEMVCAAQEQAADGAFTVVLLAEMEPALRWHGPWFYPRLLWEAGAAAQVLALGATAFDLATTPMGRFHDELAHVLLGLEDRNWQAVYAVAVGVGVEDPRLETYPPY